MTRQVVPVTDQIINDSEAGVRKGAYFIKECNEPPEIIFIATGSEVSLSLETANLMSDKRIRVVSMPCMEIYDSQSDEYKNELIPSRGCLKVTLEAGVTQGWEKYAGPSGLTIGIDHFGASAPAGDLAKEFGFTPEKVEQKIRDHLNNLL